MSPRSAPNLCVVLAAAMWLGGLLGCTSFATVRSAEVHPGPSLTVQASIASPPGDEAAWFWTLDCAGNCDRPIAGVDVAFAYAPPAQSRRPYALGFGVNGAYPYAEAYVQLGGPSSRRPFGVGGRVGLPVWSWTNHQLYGRLDVPLGRDAALLWNPGLVYHVGNSPNGENPGSFLGLVQGVGLRLGTGPALVTPSAALVWGRAERRSSGRRIGPTTRIFATGALSVSYYGSK